MRISLAALVLVAVGSAAAASAQPSTSGPLVTLDRRTIEPGERVVLTIDGFTAVNVTISVCGNEAQRGSVDCNMFASKGLKLDQDGTSTITAMPLAAPPVPCPCVVRVSDRTNAEIAVAPITLIGHPVEPIVEGPRLEDPLDVSISVSPAPPGALQRARASLGGPATYEVTITVTNRATVPLHRVAIAGSAARSNDQLATLALDDPGEIAPGRTWQQVVSAVVPGPSFGTLEWRIDVSGAGATVTANATTRERPLLLMMMAMLLVADLFLLAIRFTVRRRVRLGDLQPEAA